MDWLKSKLFFLISHDHNVSPNKPLNKTKEKLRKENHYFSHFIVYLFTLYLPQVTVHTFSLQSFVLSSSNLTPNSYPCFWLHRENQSDQKRISVRFQYHVNTPPYFYAYKNYFLSSYCEWIFSSWQNLSFLLLALSRSYIHLSWIQPLIYSRTLFQNLSFLLKCNILYTVDHSH